MSNMISNLAESTKKKLFGTQSMSDTDKMMRMAEIVSEGVPS